MTLNNATNPSRLQNSDPSIRGVAWRGDRHPWSRGSSSRPNVAGHWIWLRVFRGTKDKKWFIVTQNLYKRVICKTLEISVDITLYVNLQTMITSP